MEIKIFLDDLREPPDASWRVFRSVPELRDYISQLPPSAEVVMSLDHDLGEITTHTGNVILAVTGYDLLSWVEIMIVLRKIMFKIHSINVHSANPVGKERMEMAIRSIMRLQDKRDGVSA